MIRKLKRVHSRFHPLLIPVILVIIALLSVWLLNSSILFTYRSRASEDVNNISIIESSSTESVKYKGDLPSCVSDFLYVPNSTSSTCFVQFGCSQEANIEKYLDSQYYSCTEQGNNEFWCSENTINESCQDIDVWLESVSRVCGCESS